MVCLALSATVFKTLTGFAVERYSCLKDKPFKRAARCPSIETVPLRDGHLKHSQT